MIKRWQSNCGGHEKEVKGQKKVLWIHVIVFLERRKLETGQVKLEIKKERRTFVIKIRKYHNLCNSPNVKYLPLKFKSIHHSVRQY